MSRHTTRLTLRELRRVDWEQEATRARRALALRPGPGKRLAAEVALAEAEAELARMDAEDRQQKRAVISRLS